jgi:hypothetical protein
MPLAFLPIAFALHLGQSCLPLLTISTSAILFLILTPYRAPNLPTEPTFFVLLDMWIAILSELGPHLSPDPA